jgi:hypothetical protein
MNHGMTFQNGFLIVAVMLSVWLACWQFEKNNTEREDRQR